MSSFWRKDDPVLFDGRVIKGGMWDYQRNLWNSQAFIKALVGGYGSGKTMIGSKRMIASCIFNAPVPIMGVSPSYRQAKRTTIPTIKALLDGRRIDYDWRPSDWEFRIRYKGRQGTLWIGSGENPDALKGPNLAAAYLDEPFIMDKPVFDQMLARVRDPRSRLREIWLTGTPEELNWGYDIIEGEDAGKYLLEMVRAKTAGNLALPPDFIDTLRKAYDEKAVQAYMNGEFINLSTGRIYHQFDKCKNLQSVITPPGIPLRLGMDFNVNPMAACVFWINEGHMHVVAEIELPNSDTEDMIKYATGRWPGIVCAYPDPAGSARHTASAGGVTDHIIIENLGLQVFAHLAHPAIRDRYNAVNTKLGDGSLTFDPGCSKLRSYCERLTHEGIRKMDHMTHLTDALGYPVEYLFPVSRIIQARKVWLK